MKNIFKDKVILLVNSGSLRKKFILEKIKKLGIIVVCLDDKKKDFAIPYIDHWILTDLMNDNGCLKAVKNFIVNNPDLHIDGAITFWDECIVLTSLLCEKFSWIGIPSRISKKIKNKFFFREFCKKNKLPTPVSKKITSKNLNSIRKMNFPVVIKPIFGAFSAFVKKINNYDELLKAVEEINLEKNNFNREHLWQDWGIMVEEYIAGNEVDVDLLVQAGKIKYFAITDNHPTREPFFLETGQNMPSWELPKNQNTLIKMTDKVISTFGVKNGCMHFEAKITKSGPIPIEINLRMGGGDVYIFSKNIWNVDLIENAILISFGIKTNIKKAKKPLKYLLGEQFLSNQSVVIKKIKVDEYLKRQKYVEEIYFEKKENDIFLAPPDGFDSNIGWVTVNGKSPEECKKRLEKAKKFIHIETKEYKK